MLESVISPKKAEAKPWDLLVLAFVVSTIAIWLGNFLGDLINAPTPILVLVIIVIALAPLMQRVLSFEEEKDERIVSEGKVEKVLVDKGLVPPATAHKSREYAIGFFPRHSGVIVMYSFLFVGLVISFSFWYTVLPYQSDDAWIPASSEVFGIQNTTIGQLRRQVTGEQTGMAAACYAGEAVEREKSARFFSIYDNNVRVMVFCFVASFLFGAGALWIISWNASIVGVFIGAKIRQELSSLPALHAYFTGFPKYSLGIALWGIPEIAAYLIAGVAGGIISVAVAKHHFSSEGFWLTVYDGTLLMLFAIFLIYVGAWVEHFFVPIPVCK
jgi:uncharacterized membrane protein SpoIIM required for sporulation